MTRRSRALAPALSALLSLACTGGLGGDDTLGTDALVQSQDCGVSYLVREEENGTFVADVTVTNLGGDKGNWALSYRYPEGQQVTAALGATFAQTGDSVNVFSDATTSALPSGASVTVQVSGLAPVATNTAPFGFFLNGVSCDGVPLQPMAPGVGVGTGGSTSVVGGVGGGASTVGTTFEVPTGARPGAPVVPPAQAAAPEAVGTRSG